MSESLENKVNYVFYMYVSLFVNASTQLTRLFLLCGTMHNMVQILQNYLNKH